MADIDGREVEIGDWVHFKCDTENEGRVYEIEGNTLYLEAGEDRVFKGDYIGGEERTEQDASDCTFLDDEDDDWEDEDDDDDDDITIFTKKLVNAGNLTGDLSGIWGDAKHIKGNASGLKGNVSGIKGDVTKLRGGYVAEISGDVSKIKGDVTGIYEDVSKIRGDVSGLDGDVSGIKGNVSWLKGDATGIKCDFSFLTKEKRVKGMTISEALALAPKKPAKKKGSAK